MASGNAVAIDSAQTYWLRVAETLRRLDRELEFSDAAKNSDPAGGAARCNILQRMAENLDHDISQRRRIDLGGRNQNCRRPQTLFRREIQRRHVLDVEKCRKDKFAGYALGAGTNQNSF